MSKNLRHIVLVGATSTLAIHCARLWLAQGAMRVTLIGRDEARCARVAEDLQARCLEATIAVKVLTSFDDPAVITACVEAVCAAAVPDTVLIAHGMLSDQAQCQQDVATCRDALIVNGLSPVLFAEAFAAVMDKVGRGQIGIIGSVAGDRGRQSNYVYGAAKGLVARYAEGMQHRFAGRGVTITLIKPGPTDTPMTAGLKAEGANLADPADVAADIVQALERGTRIVYTPRKWQIIMLVIRHIPACIFAKLRL